LPNLAETPSACPLPSQPPFTAIRIHIGLGSPREQEHRLGHESPLGVAEVGHSLVGQLEARIPLPRHRCLVRLAGHASRKPRIGPYGLGKGSTAFDRDVVVDIEDDKLVEPQVPGI
jgi:hypothetical protein